MRLVEFRCVMIQDSLLLVREDAVLVAILQLVRQAPSLFDVNLLRHFVPQLVSTAPFVGFWRRRHLLGQVIVVFQFRQVSLLADGPGKAMIMRDKDHVIGVDHAERSHAITDDGEESDKDVIDNVYNVRLFAADIDPANQEEDPGKAEEGDEHRVECYEETDCCGCQSVWV